MPTVGLFGINMGACATPDGAIRAARLAEQLGYDSLWAGEHVVAPRPRAAPSLIEPDYPIVDPLVALALLAAETSRVRLATGIVILPQRNPVVLAKQVATLDVLSGGRVTLGVGAGYLEPEFRALGANFAERGAVTDEHLEALQALWYDEHPEYHGRFADFAGVDAHPRPLQQPIPLVVAGHSPPAYRRAVGRAHGWYGYWLTPDDAAAALAGLRAAADRVDRPAELGELEVSVTPRGRITAELAATFADLGVHRLVLLAPPTPDGPARTIEAAVAATARL
jgi:probable F420-dependent oxidoreductase